MLTPSQRGSLSVPAPFVTRARGLTGIYPAAKSGHKAQGMQRQTGEKIVTAELTCRLNCCPKQSLIRDTPNY